MVTGVQTCALPISKKEIEDIQINKKGTHQLELRRMSANVLLGATNVFTRRCGSERPGPVGSGVVGGTGAEYMGGGGGVGPVGELINHPTCKIIESYSFRVRNQLVRFLKVTRYDASDECFTLNPKRNR